MCAPAWRERDDRLDLQQGFVDLATTIDDVHLIARLGRQELVLGPRFVTTRDSGNVRQRHDMVRLIVEHGPMRVDLFYGRPTEVRGGAFDDVADQGQQFYGARLQHLGRASTLEAYAYVLDRDQANLDGVVAHDNRLSVGGRAAATFGRYDFDTELVVQTGGFGGDDIHAYGFVFDGGAKFDAVRFGARLTYGSGDAKDADHSQSTFNPAFSTSSWFGQNGLASFSNTVEVAGTANLNLTPDLTSNFKVGGVWRATASDFLYNSGNPLPGTDGGSAWTGASLSAALIWRPTTYAAITTYGSYVAVSDSLRERGAHDVAYALTSLTLRF